MLGHHDVNNCAFDLWSPVDPSSKCQMNMQQQGSGNSFNGRKESCATENRAFSAYAKHSQEIEDVINMICENGVCSIMTDDDMSYDDLRHIEDEVYRRSGMRINITD